MRKPILQLLTVSGIFLGLAVAGIARLGPEFATVATFTAIVMPFLRTRPMVASALSSAVAALLARGLPYKLGLMLAAPAGVIVGVWFQPEEWTDEAA